MEQHQSGVLDDPAVRVALKQAWQDSRPGVSGGHEEGGFTLRDSQYDLRVVRWPAGEQNEITLPPHPHCMIGGSDIVATFHTHPNTASHYIQEPSETDKRAVRDDPDLKGEFYEGEFVRLAGYNLPYYTGRAGERSRAYGQNLWRRMKGFTHGLNINN